MLRNFRVRWVAVGRWESALNRVKYFKSGGLSYMDRVKGDQEVLVAYVEDAGG